MKKILEIRAGEGGDDSKLLTVDLAKAYKRLCERMGWSCEMMTKSDHISLAIEGDDLDGLDNESGGHRFQRVPPTERRGRVHTSTVTVAVMDGGRVVGPWDSRNEDDFSIEWYSGSGAHILKVNNDSANYSLDYDRFEIDGCSQSTIDSFKKFFSTEFSPVPRNNIVPVPMLGEPLHVEGMIPLERIVGSNVRPSALDIVDISKLYLTMNYACPGVSYRVLTAHDSTIDKIVNVVGFEKNFECSIVQMFIKERERETWRESIALFQHVARHFSN